MLSVKDMADLLYIREASEGLIAIMLGMGTSIAYHQGILGALSRVNGVIERNVREELKKNNYKRVWEIAQDTSLTMEQRAEMLLGGTDKVSGS